MYKPSAKRVLFLISACTRFIIQCLLKILQLESWLNIIGIVSNSSTPIQLRLIYQHQFISLGRLIWISIQLPTSIEPEDELKWAWISIMIYTISLGSVFLP
jgi:hypothetical protein